MQKWAEGCAERENQTADEECCRQYLLSSVQKGLADIEAGRIFSYDEVKNKFQGKNKTGQTGKAFQ